MDVRPSRYAVGTPVWADGAAREHPGVVKHAWQTMNPVAQREWRYMVYVEWGVVDRWQRELAPRRG